MSPSWDFHQLAHYRWDKLIQVVGSIKGRVASLPGTAGDADHVVVASL